MSSEKMKLLMWLAILFMVLVVLCVKAHFLDLLSRAFSH